MPNETEDSDYADKTVMDNTLDQFVGRRNQISSSLSDRTSIKEEKQRLSKFGKQASELGQLATTTLRDRHQKKIEVNFVENLTDAEVIRVWKNIDKSVQLKLLKRVSDDRKVQIKQIR